MRTWLVCLAAVLVVCIAAEEAFAARAEDVEPVRPPRAGRVWGKVKEISLARMKLAVEVETEKDKTALRIFLLTKDTQVRKQEHVKGLEDVKKGTSVIVFFRPTPEDPKTPTAVLIRIPEGRKWGPKKP